MSKRERGLLEAIWSQPDDRAARIVYADFLQQQGSRRGEYMALKLHPQPTPAFARKLAQLEKQHGAEWLGAARPFVRSWTFDHGGFFDRMITDAHNFLDGHAHIAALGPRLRLQITSVRKQKRTTVSRLAQVPLASFYELCLEGNTLADRDLATLGDALAGIQRLDLSDNDLSAPGLAAVAPKLAGIRALSIQQMLASTCEEWIATLLASPGLGSLREVWLGSQYEYDRPSQAALRRLQKLPEMQSVVLYEWGRGEVMTPSKLDRDVQRRLGS